MKKPNMSEAARAERIPFDEIPIVDLALWFSGDEEAKEKVSGRVYKACREVGFLYIRNHGIPDMTVEATFEAAQRFFGMDEEAKRRVHYEKSGGYRGYIPLSGESSDPAARGDLKESFDVGLVLDADDSGGGAATRMRSPNLWPENLPGFREDIECYFDGVRSLAGTMFALFATSLGMPGDTFDTRINRPIAQMRLLHYPPQDPPENEDYLGIGAHSDYEWFTILAQDAAGGLQVKHPSGRWVAAPPIPGTMVINVGEMLQRWSNDAVLSTPHRVVNLSGQGRFSIPFFFGPNYDTPIAPLESCVGPRNPSRYAPIRAGDFLAGRIKEVYGY